MGIMAEGSGSWGRGSGANDLSDWDRRPRGRGQSRDLDMAFDREDGRGR